MEAPVTQQTGLVQILDEVGGNAHPLQAADLLIEVLTHGTPVLDQLFHGSSVGARRAAQCASDGVDGPGELPKEETVFLTVGEVNALADSIQPRFRAMLLLAGYRGLRFGEAAGLRPRRLQLSLGRVQVAEALKEVAGNLYFGLPKHGRVRTIVLPPFLVEGLEEHVEAFPPKSDLVFTNSASSLLRRSNFERRVWAPAVSSAGLNPRLTFHGLRRTAASILIAEGASIVELAAIMGWSSSTAVAMSMRYGHLFAARQHQLTEAIERVFRNAGRPGDGLGIPASDSADAAKRP